MKKLNYCVIESNLSRIKLIILAISILLVIGFSQQIAKAITMKAYALSDLQNFANLIIKGRIKTTSYQRINGRLVTLYKWEVTSTYKSEFRVANPVNIMLPGGIENGLEQIIPGIPKLDQSKEYFAFLKCGEVLKNICQPIGYGQGLWQQVEQAAQSSSQSNRLSQADSSSRLWQQLTEHVRWFGSAPQHPVLSLEQLLGKESFKDESQHHWPLNEVQP